MPLDGDEALARAGMQWKFAAVLWAPRGEDWRGVASWHPEYRVTGLAQAIEIAKRAGLKAKSARAVTKVTQHQ